MRGRTKWRSVYKAYSRALVTMETKFGERPNADACSPQSEAVANELQELSLQPASSLLPITKRRSVLQLKLQQRRTRAELINQGIMPPLKSSAAFHEQRRSLERARTEDYLKRKIRSRPVRSELIRMHILEETSAEPSLQARQLQLKKARLADDLNDKISHRPGPMELIHKNILPVHSSIKQVIETQFPKASGNNSSCDEDSNDSLSPEQSVGQESPLGMGPLPSPPETLAESSTPSPTQVPPSAPLLPPLSGTSPELKLSNGTVTLSAQRMGVTSQSKSHSKPYSDRSAQRHKKPKDNKPKIKKLKYHQYIPPDQKGDKEPLLHLDSSYAKILQQQQLFLQLQILSQQQQHYNYHAILPAPPKLEKNQQPSSTSNSITASSPPRPLVAPSSQGSHSSQSSAALVGTKPVTLPPNLDEMKVVELKSQLKLRSLPVSGTKNGLIERLRTYQELNGGGDTTSSPTAGGIAGPGAAGTGRSSQAAAAATTTDNTSQQQQFRCRQTSSLTSQLGSTATPPSASPQQLVTCSGLVSSPAVFSPLSDRPPATSSPEDSSFCSDPSGEMMRSPVTQSNLQLCPGARLQTDIKEEVSCSTPAPCQFSSKPPASLQKHCLVSSAAPNTKTAAPSQTIDKDKMLREKDKQIEELTMMLRQKQRLVDVLRMQLEHGKRVSEPVVLVRVKQEPPDKPGVPLSCGQPPFLLQTSCVMDATKFAVKQEVIQTEDVVPETTMQSVNSRGLPRPCNQTQEAQEQIQLHTKPQKEQHDGLQQSPLQLAQQQAIQKLLLQQQQNIQRCNQVLENQQNLQRLSQQRKKKSHKQQLKLQQQEQLLQSQQMQLKQQILMKQQQKMLFQQQMKRQQPTKQPQQIQIQTEIHLTQHPVQTQQKQQVPQQQSPQVSQEYIKEQSGSAPSFPPWSDSTPALVTDGNGNHFLIALSNHLTENQRADTPETTNPITLQAQNRRPQGSVDEPQQGAAQCVTAPPSLQPFLKDQEAAPSWKHTSSPCSQTEVCSSLDVLFSPLSPASNQTAASSPDNKDTEHEDDFIDIILQTGEMSAPFHAAPDSSLDRLDPSSCASSPLQLLLSPPVPPSCDTHQPAPEVQSELRALAVTTEEVQCLGSAGGGRLEDFLESTMGKPLLGVEPGGLLTLIDDLHSQMLCTPSILDNAPSPMDTFDMGAEGEHGLDSMDWLDLTLGRERGGESPSLSPLGPQTPPSAFSTDFLDSSDLQIHWDSCL
ncbi:myocardin-related transcription factor B isoform X3 [Scophthalmus maximus]|uniref:myocardin-related transcription factor B isoform X3 n=1 Tax=Scophthalmus maximus TaxID=52904 RepID=UPI001FA93D16|nr:myocardin-related transcription factor B isoform X3 [Scophthalmus maximus]